MASESEGGLSPGHRGPPAGRGTALVETAVVLLVFAASGAWPTPDINETVYLTKALHYAEPTYGGDDWFLSTPDAHTIFYGLMGPILAAFGLETGAWIGRWLGWLALAGGFRHAVAPLVPTAWGRLLAAGLFAVVLRHTTVAGEWVIGGCEAKVFAWALVLPAIGELARGRLAAAVFLLGGATAFHPIVGGWGLVAVGLTWLRERISADGELILLGRRAGGMSSLADTLAILTPTRPPPCAVGREVTGARAALRGCLVVGGVVLAACGIVPTLGLSAGVDAAGRAAADRIYVVERLPHHLLPGTFPEAMVARHLLAILLGVIMHRIVPATPARTRVAAFRETALSISLVGCLIAAAEPLAPDLAIGLLRFYWFRLADVVVPFTLAASAAALLVDATACGRALPGRPALVRGLVVAGLVLDLVVQSRHWPLPGRAAIASRADTKVAAAAWVDACSWVRDHVPAGSRFLTPRGAASFTWRTGLPEVVAWKNSPQDAASLLEWRRRITDCFSRDGTVVDMERSTAALGADRMREVAGRYAADHAIVPLDVAGIDALPFERLYSNGTYGVFRLVPPPDSR
jgi:hypothetical protein